MSDVPAPSAPAAPTPSTPAPPPNGAPTPTTPKPGAPRSTDGRFQPKDSNVGAVKDEAPTPAKEPFRFRAKIKARDTEEEVDLDEAGLKRRLEAARGRELESIELKKKLAEKEAREALAKDKTDEYLRSLGVDPDEFARARIGKLIELEAMTEEQRQAASAMRERDELAAKLKDREDKDAQVKRELQKRNLRAQRVEKYKATFAAGGEPSPTHEDLYLMAETEKVMCWEDVDDGKGGKKSVRVADVTPEELYQETQQRIARLVSKHLGPEDSPDALKIIRALGAKRLQAVLAHTLAEWEKSQGTPPPPKPVEPVESAARAGSSYKTEAEVDRAIKEMMRRR